MAITMDMFFSTDYSVEYSVEYVSNIILGYLMINLFII